MGYHSRSHLARRSVFTATTTSLNPSFTMRAHSINDHVHRPLMHATAAEAFMPGGSNLRLGARKASEDLPEIEVKYPGSLQRQFILLDSVLWEVERYGKFSQWRRQLISTAFGAWLHRWPTSTV